MQQILETVTIMAQYDILKLEFNIPPEPGEPAQLSVLLDNPEQMKVEAVAHDQLPDDVEVVAPGGEPTEPYWVYQENYHLCITLVPANGPEELSIPAGYWNAGDPLKFLDVVVAKKHDTGARQTHKIIRKSIIVGEV